MPRITKISVQQRDKNRVSIFIDGEYSFSLAIDQMIEEALVKEKEISDSDIKKYKKLSNDGKFYNKALDKLSRRQHSVFEIQTYLKQKGAEEELVQVIVDKLLHRGYLNDQQFAEVWIENRRRSKKRSNRMLKNELQQKGIQGAIIDELLQDTKEDEQNALRDLIAKKKKITRYKDKDKLMKYLISKGFQYAEIKNILDS